MKWRWWIVYVTKMMRRIKSLRNLLRIRLQVQLKTDRKLSPALDFWNQGQLKFKEVHRPFSGIKCTKWLRRKRNLKERLQVLETCLKNIWTLQSWEFTRRTRKSKQKSKAKNSSNEIKKINFTEFFFFLIFSESFYAGCFLKEKSSHEFHVGRCF